MKFFLLTLIFVINVSANATAITTIGKQKPDDASHDYFIGLLQLVLTETSSEYGKAEIKIVPHPGQERVMKFLEEGSYFDVAWSGSSSKREEKLLKVSFPLFKGGLGWRGSIIKKDNVNKFSSIKGIGDMQNEIACQGAHWPDADILEEAGLTVYRVGHFDAMLQMVELQRCDYLPLSIFEGQAELDLVQKSFPNLIFYQQLIIKYALTMNFFVNIKSKVLAQRLELGLLKLHLNGKFDQYMRNNKLTKAAFPLDKYKNSQVLQLNNNTIKDKALAKYGLRWLND